MDCVLVGVDLILVAALWVGCAGLVFWCFLCFWVFVCAWLVLFSWCFDDCLIVVCWLVGLRCVVLCCWWLVCGCGVYIGWVWCLLCCLLLLVLFLVRFA